MDASTSPAFEIEYEEGDIPMNTGNIELPTI